MSDHRMRRCTGADSILFIRTNALLEPITPPPSPSTSTGGALVLNAPTFNPAYPKIGPEDAVVLPCDKVGMYLDGALTVLGLHLEARTSFITFVLRYISVDMQALTPVAAQLLASQYSQAHTRRTTLPPSRRL